jgi:recombination endonuclease VII
MTAATSRRGRDCPGCDKPLSPGRLAARKKYCGPCDFRVKAARREAAHDRRVEKLYGLLPGEYRMLYAAQGEHCAVLHCRARGITRSLAVDHDHAIGLYNRDAVRGLLCKRHNRIVGEAGDNPEVFESLARYLRDPPAREVLGYGPG